MLSKVATIYFLLVISVDKFSVTFVHGVNCLGCLELDDLTFDKILPKFSTVLVKFDIAYPHGKTHEEYSKFALDVHTKDPDFVVCIVGIKDYGDKKNVDLAERFDVVDQFPSIKLFVNGDAKKWANFPNDQNVTAENLRQFIRWHSNFKLAMTGCLEQFDDVAVNFTATALRTTAQSNEIEILVRDTENNIAKLKNEYQNQRIAKIYLLIMKRIRERDIEFIGLERSRLRQLLEGNVTQQKKKEINQKLNILSAFKLHGQIKRESPHTEL